MNSMKCKKFLAILIILYINSSILLVFSKDINVISPVDNNNAEQKDIAENLKTSNGVDRSGKVFTTTTSTSQNLYINRDLSSLNRQPSVYIPNYYLSRATMNFENITAINYTRSLEDDPSEVIWASDEGPTYIYQKFSVEVSQFVNNVSIFIQDLNLNPIFTDENSWEVAIVNCSNDSDGTPNSIETLGVLQLPHPTTFAAHWEVFDFKNVGNGPILLNISNTNSTIESGVKKYWFALRIKIPPDDEGPKFLYFNPDGGDPSNKGAGDTHLDSEITFKNSTINNVIGNRTWDGTLLSGGLESFKNWTDNDRYLVEDDNYYVNITTRFQFNNLTNSDNISYYELSNPDLVTLDDGEKFNWWVNHYEYLYGIDLYLAINVSNNDFIDNTTLWMSSPSWDLLYSLGFYPQPGLNVTDWFKREIIDLNQTDENLFEIKIRNPLDKLRFIIAMHPPWFGFGNINPNNSITFRFEYHGSSNFNVSIGQFSIVISELDTIQKVHPSDPLIRDLNFANNLSISNATTSMLLGESLEALEVNDNDYYRAQADSNNLTVEFNLNVLNNIDNSFWDVDYDDWLTVAPNPRILWMAITVRCNTSINNPRNITLATLEFYKGNQTNEYLNEEQNKAEWMQLSYTNRSFAFVNETKLDVGFPPGFVWIILQFLNESNNNPVRMRLRFETNETQGDPGWRFNVTIEEFSVLFLIDNAISSDILSKISFGLNSDTLKPEDINMQNFGVNITNVPGANQTGLWDVAVSGGIPDQGIFEFNVTSLWNEITFDVSGTYEIYKLAVDIEFDDRIKAQYMSGTNYFSVEVTDGSGDPIEDLEIKFELLDSNGKVVDDDTAVTNDEGIAKGALDFKELGEKYSVKVSYGEEGFYSSKDIESREFRIVDDFTLFTDTFQLFLPYILIGVAAFSTFAAIRHRKMSKLREQWAGETLILDDLLKISYIMIIHKIAGTTIYSKQISMELDSDLIGGFLTAISQFRSEIQKPVGKTTVERGFQMDYYDFKIIIHDGSYVRVALILDGTPSEQLEINQKMFTERFEARFSPLIKDFSGDIRPFSETDAIIEEYFNISLMYPFQLATHWDVSKLEKLERALLEVAEQMQKERNFFFVGSLLSYGIAGRKESRDQIISTIIDLKKRGLIVPIELE